MLRALTRPTSGAARQTAVPHPQAGLAISFGPTSRAHGSLLKHDKTIFSIVLSQQIEGFHRLRHILQSIRKEQIDRIPSHDDQRRSGNLLAKETP